jgi:hypothetical protein
METLRRLPFKTRLPAMAWALAGLVTIFSMVASLVHTDVVPQRSVPVSEHTNSATDRASLTDALDMLRVF